MSFILDALKKSEVERQRQSSPGLMDTGIAAARTRFPWWAIAIGVLLGVNMVVMLVLLVRREQTAATLPVPKAAVAPALPVPAAPPTPAHFSPLDTTPVYAPEIPVPESAGEQGGESSSAAANARRERPLAAPPPRRAEAPLSESPSAAPQPADNDEVLPSINELSLSGTQALPELHLDVHVYATSPADRFVYINMRKYREGAQLAEGPTVERIRRDGVVLTSRE